LSVAFDVTPKMAHSSPVPNYQEAPWEGTPSSRAAQPGWTSRNVSPVSGLFTANQDQAVGSNTPVVKSRSARRNYNMSTQAIHHIAQTMQVALPSTPKIGPGGCYSFFLPIQPSSSPGYNQLTITQIPPGIKAISIWMTELIPENGQSHAGGATFQTISVQLDQNNSVCRVIFTQNWTTILAAAAQVICA
jgi:hypothetical protein